MCDNGRDCPNAEDEKYCRLTMKYREIDIKNGIKLVGGDSKYEGNVYLMGKPVCDDVWSDDEAKVVCRSLGFSSKTIPRYYQNSMFGKAPKKDYILDNVQCAGSESHLGQCKYHMVHNCGENEVAGVFCLDPASLELRGIKDSRSGAVYISEKPVCDDGKWSDKEAQTVCRHLYPSKPSLIGKAVKADQWVQIYYAKNVMSSVHCNYKTKQLTNCRYTFKKGCSQFAGVACIDNSTFGLSKSHKFFATKSANEYVIAKLPDSWTSKETSVLCKQLTGHPYSAYHKMVKGYRTDGYKCLIRDVKCRGDEKGIEECSYDIVTDCPSSFYHISVKCAQCGDPDFIKIIQSASPKGDQQQQYQAVLNAISKLKSSCKQWDCSQNEYSKYCDTLDYLNRLKDLVKPYKNNIVFLNTKFDYSSMLQLNFINQKFSNLQLDIQNIGDKVDSFQQKLGAHFKKMETFDAERIRIEVNTLTDDWDNYKGILTKNTNALKTRLGDLKTIAATVVSLDIIEQVADVVMLSIQTYVGGIDDAFGNIVELRRTLADLAKKAADAARIHFIGKEIAKLQKIYTNLQSRMERNKDKIAIFKKLFSEIQSMKQDFDFATAEKVLANYEGFEGAMDPIEIAEVGAILDYIVDKLCTLITESSSITGNVRAAIAAANGVCPTILKTVSILMETFGQIEGNEDSLINAFVMLARAKLAESSAGFLSQALQTDLTSPLTREILKHFSMFVLREQKRKLVKEACDKITYLNHGVEQDFCTQALSDLDSDITRLIGYQFTDMCPNPTHENVVIPVQTLSSNKTRLDLIDIGKLLQGSDDTDWQTSGEVFFQIPDEKWMVENGWLQGNEKGPFFVKQFEIFLPPQQPNGTRFRVESDLQLMKNEIKGKRYAFDQPMNFALKYDENENIPQSCRERIEPYSTCSRNSRYPICIKQNGRLPGKFYPSLNALWKLRIRSKYPLPQIYQSTPFYLQARIEFCTKSTGTTIPKTRKRRNLSFSRVCCPSDQYFDIKTNIKASGQNPCKKCPSGAVRISGYFCENCPTGMQPGPDVYGCQQCPVGMYKDVSGSQLCQKCPLGKTTPKKGSTECI
ncbi:uncharacterized protein [Clytia hemisphaerica]